MSVVKKKPRYDDDFRASAVIMLESQGYPDMRGALTAVANHLDVPARTLSRWFRKENNAPPDELVRFKKGDLKANLKSLLDVLVAEMLEAAEGAPLNQLAISFGVAFDKLQNLEGQPNERIQHDVSITDAERVQRINALLDAARARRDGHAPDGDASMVLH